MGMELQEGKVHNLELACARLDRLVICREKSSRSAVVGPTTRRKGYLDGLEVHGGALIGAPGGGLCQMANLVFWMAVNLDLEIVERHRHETDLFADDERTVPFGNGRDGLLQLPRSSVSQQLEPAAPRRVSLRGRFLSNCASPVDVQIVETSHRFVRRR